MAAAVDPWLGEKSIAINIYSELSARWGVHIKLLCISPNDFPKLRCADPHPLSCCCVLHNLHSLCCGGPSSHWVPISTVANFPEFSQVHLWGLPFLGKSDALFPLGETGTIFLPTLNSPLCPCPLLRCLVTEGEGVCGGGGVSLWTQESTGSWMMSLNDDYLGFKNVSFSALACFLSLRWLGLSQLQHA